MAASTVSTTGISSTTEISSTFATSITPSTVVFSASSTLSSASPPDPSETAANKSGSSPWDNLNLLLIFVPLARHTKVFLNTGRAWTRTTQGLKTLVVETKTRLLQWFLRVKSFKKPTEKTAESRVEMSPAPDKRSYPPESFLPDDPFPDTSTIASRSIHE
ncbi:hypothetical protein F503_05679 [Ophiostoma piceae UAMH 11346]|uniref:Uncharacterized protein n=1 Tax=Ophiostoma piceae (strain UAMH 11346) TaxID=1262450 RepID=S3CAM6_OPHP1|nr:hypothetical protein F503_05679 [Ophiostoma piceae UAMH 11346]